MASSPTPIFVIDKLRQLGDEMLHSVVHKIRFTNQSLCQVMAAAVTLNDDMYRELYGMYAELNRHFHNCLRFTIAIAHLYLDAKSIVDTQTAMLGLHVMPDPAAGADPTFSRFQDLPAELRLMVWEAAARPSSCRHYLETFSLDAEHGRKDPVAPLLADNGLWKACAESRAVMYRQYGKAFRAYRNNKACQFDLADVGDKYLNEWYGHQLAKYNTDCVGLQLSLRLQVWELRAEALWIDNLLMRLMSSKRHSEMAEAARQWFPQPSGRIRFDLDKIISPCGPEVHY
ncbi:hypothetical protein SCUCBS95973_001506 [Sporothrix curviconia]|uniref:2EXR domain-containing protein n=1 Tax=Sporothrix curviconia TaxID=1260050 RepID=A0ABP0AZ61_9PEZI